MLVTYPLLRFLGFGKGIGCFGVILGSVLLAGKGVFLFFRFIFLSECGFVSSKYDK